MKYSKITRYGKIKKMIVFLMLLLLLSGCGSNAAKDTDNPVRIDGVYVIEERFFVYRMWDIFDSPNDYLGHTIQYEGMFRTLKFPNLGDFYQVFRYTEGCCGDDGIIGLNVSLDNINIEPFPDGAWVEVTGVLEEFEVQGQTYLWLKVTTITEMDERGAEFVSSR